MYTECMICIQTFSTLARLQQHDISEHNAPYTCSLCGNILVFAAELKRHIATHLGVKPQTSQTNGFVNQTDDILCIPCDEGVHTTTDLEKHKYAEENTVKQRSRVCMTMPRTERSKYKSYLDESVSNAYAAVVIDGMAIRKAARCFGVPISTLHDRCTGKVDADCHKSGPEPFLSTYEEAKLVAHIQSMAAFGYSHTRQDFLTVATDLAICLGKKTRAGRPMSLGWFYGLLKRFPDLIIQKPKSLAIRRAKATSEEVVSCYYFHLEQILDDNDLKKSPERIYNIDEKVLKEKHKPTHVDDASRESVSVPCFSTTTVIGCGNAIGHAIPPYFIFEGERMQNKLLEGGIPLPGANGTVSDSGWSNSEIFQKYLAEHFVKYSVHPTAEKPVLILYDGHQSHISIVLSEWARERHIILFVLPAHTSHVLKPLDVGCFGPFEKIYCDLRNTYMRKHSTKSTEKQMCQLGCQAYSKALTQANLQASFRTCGIFPFNRHAVNESKFVPMKISKSSEDQTALPDESNNTNKRKSSEVTDVALSSSATESFSELDETMVGGAEPTKKRKVMSASVGGGAITDNSNLEKDGGSPEIAPAPKETDSEKVSCGEKMA